MPQTVDTSGIGPKVGETVPPFSGTDQFGKLHTLEYQACDDTVCYNPARVPIAFTLSVRALDRRPPGG